MKNYWKKYFLPIIFFDILVAITLYFLIDRYKIVVAPFSTSVIAYLLIGVLTLISGFWLAWRLIERDRLNQEKKRIERAKSSLIYIKNQLRPWLYAYAYQLAEGYEPIRKFERNKITRRVSDDEFLKDKPLLEDIFAVRKYDSKGNFLTGTGADFTQIDRLKINAQSLLDTVIRVYGKEVVKRIEYEIKRNQRLHDYICEGTTEINFVRDLMDECAKKIEEWQKRHAESQITNSKENIPIRHNLRDFGAKVLNILVAIDGDISKLSGRDTL